jgi:hypothetical protein
MEYNKIVAVTGMPGLYEVLGSKSDGAIVRSLEDGNTKFVSSRIHNLSHLESIEIYTVRENVPLSDVLTAMKNSKEALPDAKDNKALKGYFEKVYPDMDFEKVYASDMKKMVSWYKIIEQHNIDFTPKEEPIEEEQQQEAEVVEQEEAPKAKPAAKAKKAAAKKATTEEEEAPAEEKPKRTRKKKTEE